MSKLKEFFELLGVQPNVGFKLRDSKTGRFLQTVNWLSVYFITNEGTVQKVNGATFPEYIPKILSGEFIVVPEPFKPKIKERYYYISCDGDINQTTFEPNVFTSDVTNVALGNCFPSENVSEEDYQKIKTLFGDVGADVSKWPR
jgi:hypothetical protein